MPAAAAAHDLFPFAVEFGQPATAEMSRERGPGLALQLPLLGGVARESIFSGRGEVCALPGLSLWSSGDVTIGWATERVRDESRLVPQTHALYSRMLAAAKDRHIYRIWNYVPRINARAGGFENYQAFCEGRSLAFEEKLGRAFPQMLSAASAVGTEDGCLSAIFVAGTAAPRHVENPEQLPAYRYPAEHGPRSPSFSRATVAQIGARRFTFISGTAAIKGHATVAPGALPEQLRCTLDNLRLISRESGTGELFNAAELRERHFKVYLRHAEDFAAAKNFLEGELLRPSDAVSYLQADICRAALNIEIEATLVA